MLKFSQILKLMSRLRLVNIAFGVYLESFLDQLGKIFDPGTETGEESDRRILQQKSAFDPDYEYKSGNKGKFDEKGVPLLLTAKINQ
jgi:hypothetical protein